MLEKLFSAVRCHLSKKSNHDKSPKPIRALLLAQDIEDRAEFFSNCGHDDKKSAMMFLSTGTPAHVVAQLYGEMTCKGALEEQFSKPQ